MLVGKRIFNRTNYRAYRNGDRVRMGLCDFNDPESKGAKFRARVLEIERRKKGTITYLMASTLLDPREWKPVDLADLYFSRWPNQEGQFRAVQQAVGAKDVHGYGKQLVDNISVITELDKLSQRVGNLEQSIEEKSREQTQRQAKLREQDKMLHRQERKLDGVIDKICGGTTTGQRTANRVIRLAEEAAKLEREIAKSAAAAARSQKAVARGEADLARKQTELAERKDRQRQLEQRRKIYKHDTELDSLFSVLKVGLVLLVTYVLKTYLGDASMAPVTFLERLATLPARLRNTPELEIVTFFYNRRDPEVMALLIRQCETINARRLRMRSGRVLRLRVDPAPPSRQPPPRRRLGKTRDRFDRH
jgi:hypothetical protein